MLFTLTGNRDLITRTTRAVPRKCEEDKGERGDRKGKEEMRIITGDDTGLIKVLLVCVSIRPAVCAIFLAACSVLARKKRRHVRRFLMHAQRVACPFKLPLRVSVCACICVGGPNLFHKTADTRSNARVCVRDKEGPRLMRVCTTYAQRSTP